MRSIPHTVRMDTNTKSRGKTLAKIVGVGLLVAVAAALLLNFINGQTVYSPDVNVDPFGNVNVED